MVFYIINLDIDTIRYYYYINKIYLDLLKKLYYNNRFKKTFTFISSLIIIDLIELKKKEYFLINNIIVLY